MENYELIIALVLGVLTLLFGYRAKKVAFFIVWFMLGYSLMSYFLPMINASNSAIATSELYQIILPIAGGIILSFLGASIEKVCVSLLVFALTILISIQYFGTGIEVLAISAGVGLVLGLLATRLLKPAIILITSGVGAYVLTMQILTLASLDQATFYFPLLIGLLIIGTIFQFSTTKGK